MFKNRATKPKVIRDTVSLSVILPNIIHGIRFKNTASGRPSGTQVGSAAFLGLKSAWKT